MTDQMVLQDGRTFHVLGPRVCVEILPEERFVGSIFVPDTAVTSVYRRGVVRAVGKGWSGEDRRTQDIQCGDHCVFVRFHANIHTNERVQEALGENVIVLEPKDILLVCEATDQVEIS